jgi:hypothetical protein
VDEICDGYQVAVYQQRGRAAVDRGRPLNQYGDVRDNCKARVMSNG